MDADRSSLAEQDHQVLVAAETAPQSDDAFARSLRGFGPIGTAAILVILVSGNVVLPNMVVLPVGAALVLLWVWRSHTSWPAIGYARPYNLISTLAIGIPSGIALKLFMKILVMPLLGADPINHAYHFLAGNRAMLPAAISAMVIAGVAEETVFRGYLFERLGRLLGAGAGAKVTIVLLTSVWFGLAHYFGQGVAGVEQAIMTGLTFGTMFAVSGRIWMPMCAHAAFDLTALAIIYWDVESSVAHLIFR